ncbi:non-specific lipid transfer protein GPI-anchored 3-like [Impatiens glandulifera]|uniref:non-specific lipid transfer protein GPI-anchored 3-like n=1 Tax=Impatiens glandulifera TaxID=253017 RepID=UPI001FB05BC8|nr:non-specific lipid transfer protein GPI-anchored 3-like [Impatiens glandulifera]
MSPIIILFFLVASSSSIKIAIAQSIPSCAQSLAPCRAFLMNNTSPPTSCCEMLKENLSCLCNASSLFSSLNINETEALTLPARCKITGGSCSNATDSASQPPPGK